MADVTIAKYDATTDNGNVQNRARGVVMPASGGVLGTGAALTAGQTFAVDIEFNDDILIVFEDTSAGANSITLDKGDYPTSPANVLGAKTISGVISDVVLIVPDKGRHIQDTGKITGSMAAAGRLWFLRMPAGFAGIAPLNV